MGHNCLHVRFFLLDLDLDLDLRIVDLDLDLDFTVAGLVTCLVINGSVHTRR